MNVLAIGGWKEKLYILRKAKFDNQRRTANLLSIAEDEKRHHVAIKNLSRLLSSSNSKHQHKHSFCLNCLQGFHSKEFRNKHFKCCIDHEVVRIDMPKENSSVRFHSGQYQFKVSFIIYIDFKAILQGSEEENNPDPLSPYTRDISHHVSIRFCTYTMFTYREVKDSFRFYRGKDCIEVFCNHIEEEAKRLDHMFPEKSMESLMLEKWREFSRARKCHICLECFKSWDEKVRDHCHYTEKYRGTAH